eukprot:TRINITY_DN2986_c0_g1_i13.p1 TRINITY_DN2986_c0_g1~~TRINITY_DN2986_c0_g1_i13.p1  ORF type:complete len:489 (-),score=96.57 TRINITY_DN2986_c0_g1_i13:116-1582(-)
MKKFVTGLITILFLVLSNASEVGEYKPYPGLRFFVSNEFMKTNSHKIMVNLLKFLPTFLNQSNSFSFHVGIWPLEVNIAVAKFSAGPVDIDESKGGLKPGDKDGSFSLALPKIRKLDVSFEYIYSSPFVEKMAGKGAFYVKNLALEADFSVVKTVSLEISRLDMQFGESTINFENPPTLFWLLQYLFNNFKGLVAFLVNKSGPLLSSLLLGDSPLAISVPLFKSYLLDLTPERQISSKNDVTVLYSLFEVYDGNMDSRIGVPPPTSFDKETIDKKNSFEIAVNDHLGATFIATLISNDDLRLKLTDDMVFKATTILHLRASSFAYFIPGLKKFTEDPLTVGVVFKNDTAVDIGEKNAVAVSGTTAVNFYLDKGTETVVEMTTKTSLKFAVIIEGKMLSAKLTEISIQDLKFGKSPKPEPCPDANIIKNEFNAFFKVVVSAVSNYILAEKIDIEELLMSLIPFLHVSVDKLYLGMKPGIFKIGGVIAIK